MLSNQEYIKLFKLAEQVFNTRILDRYNFLMQSQYWDKDKIKKYQLVRLNRLISHAYKNVPYYRYIFEKHRIKVIKSLNDLKKIPVLTKKIIKTNNICAKNFTHKRFANFTSGSTGEPSKFYLTKEDVSWIWGATFRNWSWFGYNFGDKYVKISLNKRGLNIKKRLQDIFMRCTYIYPYKTDEESIKKYVNRIIRSDAGIIYSYSPLISFLADYMNKNRIRYKAKAVVTTGDNLQPQFKNNIETTFKCRIYDDYGCGGEGLNNSAMCEQGRHHINEELLIIEELNGEAVITSLNNYAMPLIRYKPGDLISLGNRSCGCGRKLLTLDSINGRNDDIIYTPDGSKLLLHFFNTCFEYIKGIDIYQIIQTKKDTLLINIVTNKDYNKSKSEKNIKNYIDKATKNSLKIHFNYVDSIKRRSSGKHKFIEVRI